MSDAVIATTGPAPIVKKRPANPLAVRIGPSMITVRARAGETRALRSVPRRPREGLHRVEKVGAGRRDVAREPTCTADTYRRCRRLSTIGG